MIDWLVDIDKQLFLWFNQFHNETWDSIMIWMTRKQSWYPFYGIIIGFLFIKFRKERWFIFVSIAILITLTEQIASGLFKPWIERLRPCHEPSIAGLVYTLNGSCGGQFGYFSAHASNTFGLAGFIFLLLKKDKFKWLSYVLFLWATVVSYSRIYLGVHYPLDILSGMICGLSVSFVIFKLYTISTEKLLHKS